MSGNIVLIGLDYNMTKTLAKMLSAELGMFYLDVNDLINYNFSNQKDAEKKLGLEYYNSQVEKICKSVCNYEGTIANMPAELFLRENIHSCIKQKCVIIFINVSKDVLTKANEQKSADKKNDINILTHGELTKILSKRSDVVVKFNGKDCASCIKDIKNALYLE